MGPEMPSIVVSGAIANKYRNGGEAWVRLSWIVGLRRLGCSVHFVEQIDPANCVDENGAVTDFAGSRNLAYFHSIMEEFGLADVATLVYGDGGQTSGLGRDELIELAEGADLLVNISGNLHAQSLLERFRRKAYVDLDPGFTQFWEAAGISGARLDGHDSYFTVGENIGKPGCPIPTGGLDWHAVRPPVVLEDWPVTPADDPHRFTTIGSWRGPYGPIEHEGTTYGLKVHEFRKVLELPQRAPLTFEIALDIDPADGRDRDALLAHNWRLVDPKSVASDPSSFRRYVQQSGGEFSVAQGIYVDTSSGWFSDRTVRYLASGKPALVQDTGWGGGEPPREGIVTFGTLEEAVDGARRIEQAYEAHSAAARALAEEHFDSDKVLARFLEETGVTRV